MKPVIPKRLPILTDIIEGDGVRQTQPVPASGPAPSGSPSAPTGSAALARDSVQAPGSSQRQQPQPNIDGSQRARFERAAPHLEEDLQAALLQALEHKLEGPIRGALSQTADTLAKELARELKPVLREMVQVAVREAMAKLGQTNS